MSNDKKIKIFSQKIFEDPADENSQSGEFICEKCDKSFLNNYYLRKHVSEEHNFKLKFKCYFENCGKLFNHKTNLKMH